MKLDLIDWTILIISWCTLLIMDSMFFIVKIKDNATPEQLIFFNWMIMLIFLGANIIGILVTFIVLSKDKKDNKEVKKC